MLAAYLQEMDVALSLSQMVQLSIPLLHLLHLHLQALQRDANLSCRRLLLSRDPFLHRQVMFLKGVDDTDYDAFTEGFCLSRLVLFDTRVSELNTLSTSNNITL